MYVYICMAKNIRHVLPTRSAIKVTVAAIKPYTDIICCARSLRSNAFLLTYIPVLLLRGGRRSPYVRASCDRKRDDKK